MRVYVYMCVQVCVCEREGERERERERERESMMMMRLMSPVHMMVGENGSSVRICVIHLYVCVCVRA